MKTKFLLYLRRHLNYVLWKIKCSRCYQPTVNLCQPIPSSLGRKIVYSPVRVAMLRTGTCTALAVVLGVNLVFDILQHIFHTVSNRRIAHLSYLHFDRTGHRVTTNSETNKFL